MMSKEQKTRRESIPVDFRFPEDRTAVTVQEIAKKWFVDDQQVFRILDREHAEGINISAGAMGARSHFRISVSSYYAITAKRMAAGFLRDPDEGPTLFDMTPFKNKTDVLPD